MVLFDIVSTDLFVSSGRFLVLFDILMQCYWLGWPSMLTLALLLQSISTETYKGYVEREPCYSSRSPRKDSNR